MVNIRNINSRNCNRHDRERAITFGIIIYMVYELILGLYIILADVSRKSEALLILSTIFSVFLIALFAYKLLRLVLHKQSQLRVKVKSVWAKSHKISSTVISALIGELSGSIIVGIVSELTGVSYRAPNNQKDLVKILHMGTPEMIWLFMIGVIFAPVIEETIFRFTIIGPRHCKHLKDDFRNKGFMISVIASVLIFIIAHLSTGITQVNLLNVKSLIRLFMGFILYGSSASMLVYRYIETNDIRYSMATHMTMNIISLAPLILAIID